MYVYDIDEAGPAPKKPLSKSRGNEDAENMKKCEDLLGELMKQDDAWPFLKPVRKIDVSQK